MLSAAVRDWRVWALWLSLQAPGLRVLVKALPALLAPLIVLWLAAAWLLYGVALHAPFAQKLARRAWTPRRLALLVALLAAQNAVIYPRVDALKTEQRGSDEDDALIQTSWRLARGERPIYAPTYLGNPPSPGLPWVVAIAPLALTGTYFLLTPLALGSLPLLVRAAGGSDEDAVLATTVPLTSPLFWELQVTGSDAVAIGVLFVALTVAVSYCQRLVSPLGLTTMVLMLAAASSRVMLAAPAVLIATFAWRRRPEVAIGLVALAAAFVAIQQAALSGGVSTPLHLIGKAFDAVGWSGVAFALAAFAAAWLFAVRVADNDLPRWLRGAWLALVAPLTIVSGIELAQVGFDAAHWQSATYLAVPMPLLVSWLALTSSSPFRQARSRV